MFCPFCDSQIPDGAATCPACGAQLSAVAPAATAPATPAAEAPAAATPAAAVPAAAASSSVIPTITPAPTVQAQPAVYQDGSQNYGTQGAASAGSMPSTGAAIALIVVGFLCGILWGIIGVTQYGPMKRAIDAGDAATAQSKFKVIAIATGIGVVANLMFIFGSGVFFS